MTSRGMPARIDLSGCGSLSVIEVFDMVADNAGTAQKFNAVGESVGFVIYNTAYAALDYEF